MRTRPKRFDVLSFLSLQQETECLHGCGNLLYTDGKSINYYTYPHLVYSHSWSNTCTLRSQVAVSCSTLDELPKAQ